MYDDISLAVQELACLVADSFYDPRMAVTGAGHADAAGAAGDHCSATKPH